MNQPLTKTRPDSYRDEQNSYCLYFDKLSTGTLGFDKSNNEYDLKTTKLEPK
jgi:hypothetical protein